jgi:ribonuclease BN (tRNA processing enzyme)
MHLIAHDTVPFPRYGRCRDEIDQTALVGDMRLTVLGGGGVWPTPEQPCGGYLLERDGFSLLIDPGYGVMAQLLRRMDPEQLGAILVTHGHPDHCADLNPLLRSRVLPRAGTPPLPVLAPPGAIDAVIALDWDGVDLESGYRLQPLHPPDPALIGPFRVGTRLLPHFVPNVGVRIEAGGRAVVVTGDCGPDPGVVALARDADVVLAEATYVDEVPARHRGRLSSAADAAGAAAAAGAQRLILTHAWPGTDADVALSAARRFFDGRLDAARPGLEVTF